MSTGAKKLGNRTDIICDCEISPFNLYWNFSNPLTRIDTQGMRYRCKQQSRPFANNELTPFCSYSAIGRWLYSLYSPYVSPPSSKVYLLPTIHPGVRPRHLTLCCVCSNIFLLLKTTFIFSGVSPALSLKKSCLKPLFVDVWFVHKFGPNQSQMLN